MRGFENILKIPELRKKIVYTFLLLAVYRVGGFIPVPGIDVNAMGEKTPMVDIAALCRATGAPVVTCDPFDLTKTRETLNRLLEERGVRVLILKQSCALSPEKKGKKQFNFS